MVPQNGSEQTLQVHEGDYKPGSTGNRPLVLTRANVPDVEPNLRLIRPWQRFLDPAFPDRFFLGRSRNYKVYSDESLATKQIFRVVSILNT